jgi:hypothetical protein
MEFNFTEAGSIVGRGRKRMILSGLRPYEKQAMDDITARLDQRKRDFQPQ